MAYYVGDPCYIIPDADWGEFCKRLFATPEFEKGLQHYDGAIEWRGQTIEIWSNGGDGSWSFGIKDIHGKNNFCVDAGIFCVIDVDKLDDYQTGGLHLGMQFEKEPTLRVEDGVIYINDVHDNSVKDCEGCGEMISEHDEQWCENGSCIGCWECFECDCEGDEE